MELHTKICFAIFIGYQLQLLLHAGGHNKVADLIATDITALQEERWPNRYVEKGLWAWWLQRSWIMKIIMSTATASLMLPYMMTVNDGLIYKILYTSALTFLIATFPSIMAMFRTFVLAIRLFILNHIPVNKIEEKTLEQIEDDKTSSDEDEKPVYFDSTSSLNTMVDVAVEDISLFRGPYVDLYLSLCAEIFPKLYVPADVIQRHSRWSKLPRHGFSQPKANDKTKHEDSEIAKPVPREEGTDT